MSFKILGVAALALGTALAAAPAFAQSGIPVDSSHPTEQVGTPGYSATGSIVTVPRQNRTRADLAQHKQAPSAYNGRNPNDGGRIQ
jgi:hypothetical protein